MKRARPSGGRWLSKGRLLARMGMELQSGAAAYKEYQKDREKEQERLKQQQQQKAAEQASSGEGKWPSYMFQGGRQGPYGYGVPQAALYVPQMVASPVYIG